MYEAQCVFIFKKLLDNMTLPSGQYETTLWAVCCYILGNMKLRSGQYYATLLAT